MFHFIILNFVGCRVQRGSSHSGDVTGGMDGSCLMRAPFKRCGGEERRQGLEGPKNTNLGFVTDGPSVLLFLTKSITIDK